MDDRFSADIVPLMATNARCTPPVWRAHPTITPADETPIAHAPEPPSALLSCVGVDPLQVTA